MEIHLPKPKNEVNINTIIQIVTLFAMIGGGGAVWGTTQAAISALSSSQSEANARITSAEALLGRLPNLEYRITVQEQSGVSLSGAVEQMRQAMSDQGADIRVMREILTRLDQQIARSGPGVGQ